MVDVALPVASVCRAALDIRHQRRARCGWVVCAALGGAGKRGCVCVVSSWARVEQQSRQAVQFGDGGVGCCWVVWRCGGSRCVGGAGEAVAMCVMIFYDGGILCMYGGDTCVYSILCLALGVALSLILRLPRARCTTVCARVVSHVLSLSTKPSGNKQLASLDV